MPKRKPAHAPGVREPAQVYLAAEDSALLLRLSTETGLSKAEILRRGIRSFAREQGEAGPMLNFLSEVAAESWSEELAVEHDRVLAEEYGASARRPAEKKSR